MNSFLSLSALLGKKILKKKTKNRRRKRERERERERERKTPKGSFSSRLKGEGDPFRLFATALPHPKNCKKALESKIRHRSKKKLIKDCIKTHARAKEERVFRVLYITLLGKKRRSQHGARLSLSLSLFFIKQVFLLCAWMEAIRTIRILFISLSTAHFASQKKRKSEGDRAYSDLYLSLFMN